MRLALLFLALAATLAGQPLTGNTPPVRFFDMSTAGTAVNPLVGNLRFYVSGGNLCWRNSSGVETCAGAGAGDVPSSRLINTTTPLTGGGDLSADRTLSCPTCVITTGSYADPAWITSLAGAKVTGAVLTTRAVNTTSPLAGGGDLSADRTLSCPTCTLTSRLINTTAPLTGGGDLTADRTIACATCVETGGSYANPSWITSLAASKITGLFYQTLQAAGTDQTQRGKLDFQSGLFTFTDDSGNNRTRVDLNAVSTATASTLVLRDASARAKFGAAAAADDVVTRGASALVDATLLQADSSGRVADSGVLTANVAPLNAANTYGTGLKQSFTHSGTTAGFRLVPASGAPSSPADGDCWYDSTATLFKCRQNGATVNMIDTTVVANLGGGTEVAKTSTNIDFRTLVAATGGAVTQLTDTVTIGTNRDLVAEWSSGTGDPSSSCATGRDFYLDTTSFSSWHCVATNIWAPIGKFVTIANAGTTGTTVNTLTKLTGAPSTAVIAGTSDTGGVVGVTIGGAGTTGSARIAVQGLVSCVFDAATTAGNYVQIDDSTAGNCKDVGSGYPTSGQILGRVLSTNGGAGTYTIALFPPEIRGSSGAGGGSPGGADGELQYRVNSSTFGGVAGSVNSAGNVTLNSGTTAADVLKLAMAQPGSAGQRDSHSLVIQGASFDTAGHNSDWRANVDVTSNAGASTLQIQSRIDAAGYTNRLSVTDGGVTTSTDFSAAAGGRLLWTGRSIIRSPADGNVILTNNAGTGFGLLKFGDETTSFPALKRSTTILQARLGDDSAYTQMEASIFDAQTGFQVAGAATSGNYLRGDGTNFVSSAIQTGDLPAAVVLDTGTNTYTAGQKQIFTHDSTNAGFQIAGASGDPSSLSNGDCWYNSTSNLFKCRQNGSTVNMIGGASSDPDAWNRKKRISYFVSHGTTSPTIFGESINATGTAVGTAGDSTDPARTSYDSASPANSDAGISGGLVTFLYGRNLQFHVLAQASHTDNTRMWVVMANQTLGTMVASNNPAGHYFGFRWVSGTDTNWQCVTKDGTTQNVVDSGVAGNTTLRTFEAIADDSVPNITFKIDGNSVCSSPVTANLPAANTLLRYVWALENHTASGARSIRIARAYIQADK